MGKSEEVYQELAGDIKLTVPRELLLSDNAEPSDDVRREGSKME